MRTFVFPTRYFPSATLTIGNWDGHVQRSRRSTTLKIENIQNEHLIDKIMEKSWNKWVKEDSFFSVYIFYFLLILFFVSQEASKFFYSSMKCNETNFFPSVSICVNTIELMPHWLETLNLKLFLFNFNIDLMMVLIDSFFTTILVVNVWFCQVLMI